MEIMLMLDKNILYKIDELEQCIQTKTQMN